MNPETSRTNPRTGFTILELLIVLVILVAILAIVGPRLLRSQAKADIKLTQVQIANLETALKEYAVDMRSFPNSEEGLEALIRKPMDEKQARKWAGPYLDETRIPSDPWDNEFVYRNDPSNKDFDRPLIVSMGPDGEINTADDIFNYRPVSMDDESGETTNLIEPLEDTGPRDTASDFNDQGK